MNSKVAFIDLDGVVADSTKRFVLATVAKLEAQQSGVGEREAVDIYWRTALNGEHVPHDELIEGCLVSLTILAQQGYCIVYLTSRPEHMRRATETWLNKHNLFISSVLMLDMKPADKQFTKTVAWKIDRLHELATNMQADEVLFVDDEPPMRVALMDRANDVPYSIKVCSSLVEACN